MTQPVSPYGQHPGAPPSPYGHWNTPVPGSPLPVAPAQTVPASAEQSAAPPPEPEDTRTPFEKLSDYADVGGTQFVRGALDALLAPAALVGAASEAVGDAWQVKAMHDFGRDLGRASSGRSAMEAISGVMTLAQGGQGIEAASAADKQRAVIEEQEKSYPMLSTISRMAGMSALAVAGGAAASGETGALANIATNAAEGAASGAQGGYEHDASLRDILVSGAIGGVIGGGISAAAEGVSAVAKKLPDLSEVFGQKLQDWSGNRLIKAAIDRDPKGWNLITSMDPERKARIVDRLAGMDIIGKGDAGMLDALSTNADEAIGKVNALAGQLDSSPGIVANTSKMEADISDQIAGLRSKGVYDLDKVARKLELNIGSFRKKLAVSGVDNFGNETTAGYRNASFQELLDFKRGLGESIDWTAKDPATTQMKKMFHIASSGLDEAADSAAPGIKQAWRSANEEASDFIMLRDSLKRQTAIHMRNRAVSASDYGSGLAAGLAGAIITGNPLGALAGLAAAGGNKVLREHGSAIFGTLANRFARTIRHVPLVAAGGPEAQEVLQAIAKTRAFVAETAERAGTNPAMRQSGEEAARTVAAEQLGRKAGGFAASEWAEKPIKPLQKVLFRSQILDAASGDVAKVSGALAEMHPPLPETLDVKRLGRLMKGGDETAGIGALQELIDQSAQAAPATAAGRSGKGALTALGRRLARTDGPESMATAHETANWLQQAQELAPDDVSREYLARTEAAIRSQLAKPEWGQAGAEYAALTAPPHEVLQHLTKPENVREVLRTGGDQMGATMRSVRQRVEAAHDAFFRLTGRPTDPAVRQQLNAAQKILHAAEAAVTLDGQPLARVFDTANTSGVYAGTGQETEPVNGETVRKNVVQGLDQIAPIIKAQASGGKMQKVSATVRAAASEPATREQYDGRMKDLSRAVSQPDEVAKAPGMLAQIAPDTGSKLAQLMNDIPKPSPSIRGKLFETLSDDQLRLANSMWEATTEPLSVMTDLARGDLDPDKAAYAWKQYPGLQKATQAGVLDVLMGLSDDERSAVPTHILTQLDSALGFNGALQDSNEPGFSKRMDTLYQPAPNKPQPGGMLETPAAKPTFTERLSGATGS